ncbi:MAG: ShlB/FhaC/HecB family hemolysin secretion/activation protein [Burkholderiaceae bacterium]|nr:ShlB/FhaC/HecB family hemolysin secretion/activation protein [Burkholderiaceae bacterium]
MVLCACVAGLALSLAGVVSAQQQRPDAGTLSEPQRQIPALPPTGGPRITVPTPVPASTPASTVPITPAAFRIQGNTLIDSGALLALLQPRVGKTTHLQGLQEAAAEVRKYYVERGYLLTDAYLPEQALPAQGGTVTIAVVEARMGSVRVRVEGAGISQARAQAMVSAQLRRGDPITEYLLDKPVLLLRDLAGHDATAVVEPGARTGEVDVLVTVKSQGPVFETSVGADNQGTRAAGAVRAFAEMQVNNPSGHGDQLGARVQLGEISRTRLYRLAYTISAGNLGSRLTLGATRTEYALGKQFAVLGATGRADVLSAAVLHPLVRSRSRNLFATLSAEHKRLDDRLLLAPSSQRSISALRMGVSGNQLDDALGTGGFTSVALNAALGRARLDDATLLLDQGVTGLRTAGSFGKLNLEVQRAQYFSGPISLYGTLQAQHASRNLSSAEKMSLGGPTGVRGYPVGEAVGDSGVIANIEARYALSATGAFGEAANLSFFYDTGMVRFNQDGAIVAGNANRTSLSAYGIGFLAGRPGNFLLSASLAWRAGGKAPTTGDPDSRPRLWLSTQKWF